MGNYSLLYVQGYENHRLILQELSIPESLVNPKTMDWEEWMRASAPGHTSWLLFEIDLQDGALQESYDVSKKEWLYLQAEDHLLVKLLHLPMRRLSDQERRRIGPAPLAGDPDNRAVWNPPQVFEHSTGKSHTSAWRAVWPPAQSLLAGCSLDLYYDTRQSDFPFPISIDIQSPHYRAHLHVVKAGKRLEGVPQRVPRRPPRFLSHLNPGYSEYKIRILCPSYYKNFQLLAIPVGPGPKGPEGPELCLEPPVPLPFQLQRGEAPEELVFTMTREKIGPLLKKGCRYRLAFHAAPYPESYAETDATFVWP
jgi:hypothetical protein